MWSLWMACTWSAGGELLTDSGLASAENADEVADTGAGADTAADSGLSGTDLDQDGWTLEDGDCDDADAGVNPDAYDGCDGADEDCDDEVDEDAADDDNYEPNDSLEEATDLGSLEDDNARTVTAWLHNEDDVDRYLFYVEDQWYDLFDVHIALSNIPDTTTYRLTLYSVGDDGENELESIYGRGTLELVLEDGLFDADSGNYELRVDPLADPDCGQSYLLSLSRESF